MGLNIVKHVYVFNEESSCGEKKIISHEIINSIFSLTQMCFIYKYGNVIVNRNKWLARFTFIHCMTSSLSFWINFIIEETLDDLVKNYFEGRDEKNF